MFLTLADVRLEVTCVKARKIVAHITSPTLTAYTLNAPLLRPRPSFSIAVIHSPRLMFWNNLHIIRREQSTTASTKLPISHPVIV